MTVLSRETVRDEIVAALETALTGAGNPVSSVYGYQVAKLDGESPVVLVLSRSTQRRPQGLGAKKYDNTFIYEVQILVYDGNDNNPITPDKREDEIDTIEAALAAWFADNQSGANYRAVYYTPDPSQIQPVIYLDGNAYLMERIAIRVEASDT